MTSFQDVAESGHFLAVFPEAVRGLGTTAASRVRPGKPGSTTWIRRRDDSVRSEPLSDRFPANIRYRLLQWRRLLPSAGNKAAGLFAAIAPVSGSSARAFSKDFRPTQPVSVLAIQGTRDPVVPYRGGKLPFDPGTLLGAEETVRDWAAFDHCDAVQREIRLSNSTHQAGCYPQLYIWGNGRNHTAVELMRIVSGVLAKLR